MVASADINFQVCLESSRQAAQKWWLQPTLADTSLQVCLESFAKIVDRQRKNGGFS